MSQRTVLAEQVAALAATGVATAGVSGPLAAVTVPLAVIGAIGLSIWRRCPRRNCERAVQSVLDSLARSPDITDTMIARASATLASPSRCLRFPPALTLDAARAGGAEGFDAEMARALLADFALSREDDDLVPLLETALRAAVAACRRDPEIKDRLTQDLLLESARANKLNLEGLARVEGEVGAARDDLQRVEGKIDLLPGQFADLLQNLNRASRDQLEALAARFEIAGVYDLTDAALRSELDKRAEDWRALRREIAAIPESLKQLSNLKGAAQAAFDAGRLDEVEELLARVHEVELEEAARSAELRAETALLRGRVDQAYTLLASAADSFRPIDPLEPARRRVWRYVKLLHDHGLRYGGPDIARVLDLLAPVLSDDLRRCDARLWAAGMNTQAVGYQELGSRTGGAEGAALLAEAVTAFRAVLEVYTRADHPVDWAMTQNNLGNALQAQGSRTGGAEGGARLAEAVTAYRAALEVRTHADHPVHWASTQNNLGAALRAQGSRTGGAEGAELLAKAVTAYRAALEVRTRADHPVDWAATQNNLGTALWAQGSCTDDAEGAALLAEAVMAYRAALEVTTRADHPVNWAGLQINIGAALWAQGSRSDGPQGAALLAEAITTFRAALEVHTRADHPLHWAMTQENLAEAEETRANHDSCTDPAPHLRAALDHVRAALEVYDPGHMLYRHQKATALRDRVQARLAGMG